jgi:hypothetical protein
MSSTSSASLSSPSRSIRPRPQAGRSTSSSRRPHTRASSRDRELPAPGALACYADRRGHARELVLLPGHAGSTLVLDRDAATLGDRRLVAHLAPEEPRENAELVCRMYLHDVDGRWCRRVLPEDLRTSPAVMAGQAGTASGAKIGNLSARTLDCANFRYRIRPISLGGSIAHMRWCRSPGPGTAWERTSLREVVAKLESYEPARTLTESTVERHRCDRGVSVARLATELDRLCSSPVVLNRGLREAVLEAVGRDGVSMSEIALRCGIVKRDRRGKVSGETSWLARRIGIMPEGGERAVTPWIHSDVLAAIARKGLGVDPREVELQ